MPDFQKKDGFVMNFRIGMMRVQLSKTECRKSELIGQNTITE